MWLAFRDDSITPVPAIAKQQQRRWRWRRRRRAGRSPLSFPAEHIFVLALILARPAPPTARARHSCPFAFVGTRVTWELLASVFFFLRRFVFCPPWFSLARVPAFTVAIRSVCVIGVVAKRGVLVLPFTIARANELATYRRNFKLSLRVCSRYVPNSLATL